MNIREQIVSLWLRVSRPEQRTRVNFRGFYRRTLHNFGARGIFEATENAADWLPHRRERERFARDRVHEVAGLEKEAL